MLSLLIIALFIGVPLWCVWFFIFGGKGKFIKKRFQSAGDLRGKSWEEVVAIGGKPEAVTDFPDGKRVATFGHLGYSIIVVFQNGICQGMNREITS